MRDIVANAAITIAAILTIVYLGTHVVVFHGPSQSIGITTTAVCGTR